MELKIEENEANQIYNKYSNFVYSGNHFKQRPSTSNVY